MESKEKKEDKPGKVLAIALDEKSRIYLFPNKQELKIDEAVMCYTNSIGTHRLQNKKGEIFIVPYKWLGLKIIEK